MSNDANDTLDKAAFRRFALITDLMESGIEMPADPETMGCFALSWYVLLAVVRAGIAVDAAIADQIAILAARARRGEPLTGEAIEVFAAAFRSGGAPAAELPR
jgi:hypothetical protein